MASLPTYFNDEEGKTVAQETSTQRVKEELNTEENEERMRKLEKGREE